jgi:hypothetical protein
VVEKEAERVLGKGKGQDIPFKHAPSDLLPPSRPYFLITHLAMNSSMD